MERGVVLTYPPAAQLSVPGSPDERPEELPLMSGKAPDLDPSKRPITTPFPSVIESRHPTAFHTSGLISISAAIILAIWLSGSLVLAVRLAVGQRRMARLRTSAIPAGPDAETLCREFAIRLRVTAPAVLRSPFLFSPCLDGLRRPAILLPDDMGIDLRDTFIHELAHLARRDGLWNLLRRSIVAAFWVQPLLGILSRRIETTAEEVCDDYVIQFGSDRTRYADHLVELAGRALPPPALPGVGMISLRSLLSRRVVRILDHSRKISTRADRRVVAASLLAGLAGTLLAGLLGIGGIKKEAKAETPPKIEEKKPDSKKAEHSRTIRGQVVDEDEKPISGATVIASPKQIFPGWVRPPWRQNPIRRESIWATTDLAGRSAAEFETPGSEDAAAAAGIQKVSDYVILAMSQGFDVGYYQKGKPIHLGRCYTPINGRVVDVEGRPVPGARIRLIQIQVPDRSMERGANGIDGEPALPGGVTTDAEGKFRIEGLGRDVMAYLALSSPRLPTKHSGATRGK
jgi:beta-lactamase regulating signal transducer with metallopeptidase domain